MSLGYSGGRISEVLALTPARIDRVNGDEVEYLLLAKTRPNKQYGVSRELRRRIKETFQKNNIQAAGPGRVYVVDQGTASGA